MAIGAFLSLQPANRGSERLTFDAKNYWESRLSERFDLRGVGDIGLPVSYNEYLYDVRASAFRGVASKLDGDVPAFDVLDVGSGTGFYIDQWMQADAASVTGSDLTEKSVEMLNGRYPKAQFTQCDIGGPLPATLEGLQFDVVSAFDMLFHIVDDNNYRTAIGNFARLVKPGGYLIFSDNLSEKPISHGPHQLSRAEPEVTAIVEAAGFTKKAIRPMFVLMNDPVRSKNRLLRKLFNRIYWFAAKGEWHGRLIGGLLYPVEIALIRLLARGPSTEIFIWQRNR